MIKIHAEMGSVIGECNACGRRDCVVYEFLLEVTSRQGISFRLCERCLTTLIRKAKRLMKNQPRSRKRKRRP